MVRQEDGIESVDGMRRRIVVVAVAAVVAVAGVADTASAVPE